MAWGFFEQQRRTQFETQKAHAETLTVLARSLELREHYTEGHSERVRAYTLVLASQLGILDPSTLETFAIGAFLHDIGKIGIPDAILLKEGPLSEGEWEAMRTHPALGASLIGPIPFLAEAMELVLTHHERFDGKGYPKGCSGEDIPMGARIFALADTFDALTTRRPYRQARAYEEAVQVITNGGGAQFDPSVVQAFLAIPFETWSETAGKLGVALRREG